MIIAVAAHFGVELPAQKAVSHPRTREDILINLKMACGVNIVMVCNLVSASKILRRIPVLDSVVEVGFLTTS